VSFNFCVLSSGSGGNVSLVWTKEGAVLIDCGRSGKYISEELAALGISPKDLTAAVITHAHIDHISESGLNFLIKNDIALYSHNDILDDICDKFGQKVRDCRMISFDSSFNIKNIDIDYFPVHHKDISVSKTLGFTLSSKVAGQTYKIGYATDTGKVCKNMAQKLAGSNILVIESNYDKEMLNSSFRPRENKKWILSDSGHLSNEASAAAVADIKEISKVKDSLKYVFLAHLSAHHNYPELALKVSQDELTKRKISDVRLFCAKRDSRSQTIKIG